MNKILQLFASYLFCTELSPLMLRLLLLHVLVMNIIVFVTKRMVIIVFANKM